MGGVIGDGAADDDGSAFDGVDWDKVDGDSDCDEDWDVDGIFGDWCYYY